MKATEAREIAEAKEVSVFNIQFDKVMSKIRLSAENAEFVCSFPFKLKKDLEEYLKELGYKAEYKQCGNNEYETIVCW